MKIFLYDQVRNPAFPMKCGHHFTGSALPVELCGIPMFFGNGLVTGVSVTVTNADGNPVTAVCERCFGGWSALFAASNFANYGFVSKGVKVVLTLKDTNGNDHQSVLGVGDIEIAAASANAQPGAPANSYAVKGGDIYCKSTIVDGVQHFVKQTVEFDPEIGWGANWGGDYVLAADGNFIPANQEV